MAEVEDSKEATVNKATTRTDMVSKVDKTMASSRATANNRAIPNNSSTHRAPDMAALNNLIMTTADNPTTNNRVDLMEALPHTLVVTRVRPDPTENEDSVRPSLEVVQLAGLLTRLAVAS